MANSQPARLRPVPTTPPHCLTGRRLPPEQGENLAAYEAGIRVRGEEHVRRSYLLGLARPSQRGVLAEFGPRSSSPGVRRSGVSARLPVPRSSRGFHARRGSARRAEEVTASFPLDVRTRLVGVALFRRDVDDRHIGALAGEHHRDRGPIPPCPCRPTWPPRTRELAS